MCAVRRFVGSSSVSTFVMRLQSTRGPSEPRELASLAGRQMRSSCKHVKRRESQSD
jgi:hypothetical protein